MCHPDKMKWMLHWKEDTCLVAMGWEQKLSFGAQCTEGCAAGGHIQHTKGAAKAERLGSTLEGVKSPASLYFLFLSKRAYQAVVSTALPSEGFFDNPNSQGLGGFLVRGI